MNTFPENVTRITLQPKEVLSLHLGYQTVQVVAGVAWITHDGDDTVMTTGGTRTFRSGEDTAAISAMRGQPLVIDILSN
jgi:quercetin dioxygenase-like cupin family protein